MDNSSEDDVELVSVSSGEEEDICEEMICIGPHSISLSKLECLLLRGKEGEMNDLVNI